MNDKLNQEYQQYVEGLYGLENGECIQEVEREKDSDEEEYSDLDTDEQDIPAVPEPPQNIPGPYKVALERSYFKNKQNTDEAKTVNRVFGDDSAPCCTLQYNRKISRELAVNHPQSFIEIEKHEQDLIILSHLQSHREVLKLTDNND